MNKFKVGDLVQVNKPDNTFNCWVKRMDEFDKFKTTVINVRDHSVYYELANTDGWYIRESWLTPILSEPVRGEWYQFSNDDGDWVERQFSCIKLNQDSNYKYITEGLNGIVFVFRHFRPIQPTTTEEKLAVHFCPYQIEIIMDIVKSNQPCPTELNIKIK